MLQEELKAGMVIRLKNFGHPWDGVLLKVIEDYDAVCFEDEDGNTLDEPWELKLLHDVIKGKRMDGTNIVKRKGTIAPFNLDPIGDEECFDIIVKKSNKPGWF